MEMLTLVLLLTIAVLISAVIDQVIPRVSLPLIQIAMGVVIALFSKGTIRIELEPSLFLVLFIAPLLYIEAKNADKGQLWRDKKPILSLAIGLVVVTTLIIGYTVHALIPSIALASAFALGAALGPTDAVAVTSLSKQVSIPERSWSILKGELLLNDASGIVSFQFALAAATTGAFSLIDASADFLIEFIGGLIFGFALGYVANLILRKVRDLGIESTRFHVLYEICIPFLVYLTASALHVSGIIAVVVAGLVNVIAPRTISPSIAHMNIVSSSVWQVISFALNGIVFVLLGTQIPTAMYYTWEDATMSNISLIMLVLLITFVLMAVRFIWCTAMEYVHARFSDEKTFTKANLRDALIVTLCGAKGTITLSILFTIPAFLSTGVRFPERDLVIFLGCGVILCTLLIATFIVPLVAPKKERKQTEIEARQNYYECLADILRNVIEQLAAQQTKKSRGATRVVIKAYQNRLAETKDMIDIDSDPNIELRIQALEWEEMKTMSLIDENLVDHDIGYDYLGRIERMKRLTMHRNDKFSLKKMSAVTRIALVRLRQAVVNNIPNSRRRDRSEEMRLLQIETTQYVIEILRAMISSDEAPTEDVSSLLVSYEALLATLRRSIPSVTTTFKIADETESVRRLAYQLELEEIQKMYEQDRISRQEAKNMRDNVHLMQMDLENKV